MGQFGDTLLRCLQFHVNYTNMKSGRSYQMGARAEKTAETGRRIVEAFLDRLLTLWYDEITLQDVASQAGVTVQTILRRFEGKEALLAEAVKLLSEQINQRRDAPRGDVERLVHQLVEDYEQTGDAVMRMLAMETRYPALVRILDHGRSEHRRWVEHVFHDSLQGLPSAQRASALEALIIQTDVYTWKLLRRDMGHSARETQNQMVRLLKAVLQEFVQENSRRQP